MIVCIMLTSIITTNISADDTLSYHRVYGYLYIDDERAPEGINITLTFPSGHETNFTNIEGYYQIDFNGHNEETGIFIVSFLDHYLA